MRNLSKEFIVKRDKNVIRKKEESLLFLLILMKENILVLILDLVTKIDIYF